MHVLILYTNTADIYVPSLSCILQDCKQVLMMKWLTRLLKVANPEKQFFSYCKGIINPRPEDPVSPAMQSTIPSIFRNHVRHYTMMCTWEMILTSWWEFVSPQKKLEANVLHMLTKLWPA